MALDKEFLERIEREQRIVDDMTPEACIGAAALLRDVKPQLTTARQKQLADELAETFKAQATQASRPAAS